MQLLLNTQNGGYATRKVMSIDDLVKVIPRVDVLVTGAHQDDEAFTHPLQREGIEEGFRVGTVIATNGARTNYRHVDGKNMSEEEVIDIRNNESIGAAEYICAGLSCFGKP